MSKFAKMFCDRDGKLSSKRIMGTFCVLSGTIVFLNLVVIGWINGVEGDPESNIAAGKALMWGGIALLGSSNVEHLNNGGINVQ